MMFIWQKQIFIYLSGKKVMLLHTIWLHTFLFSFELIKVNFLADNNS